jgi:two-component system response regulator (stage 0 sporulation protein F)
MSVKKKRILLVDDEEGIQLLYREEFEDEGYEVTTAYNGEEALEEFSKEPPDLVILDINMPGMNGIEVLRRMKEIDPDLPVILSSAYQEYKQDLGTWASEEYIVKSSNMDELKNAVRKHLG